MTEKRITKKMKYAMLLEIAEVQVNEMLVEFINKEIEQLDKKSANKAGTDRKPTAKQLENEALAEKIIEAMEIGTQYRVSDLIAGIEACNDLSVNKVSAIMNGLVKDENGVIIKENDGRTTYFVRIA